MMSANSSALVNQRGALSMSMRPPPPGFGAPPGFGGPAAWAARQPTSLAYGFDSSSRQSMRSAAVQSVTARAPTRNPPN